MNLQKPAQELLSKIYQNYQETGDLQYGLVYSDDAREKQHEIRIVDQLVLAGLIQETLAAVGFTQLKLTKKGIDYFEETIQPQPQIFNINVSGNVENSILGSQTNAAINIGADIAQIESLISLIPGPDRELLSSLPQELSDIQKTKEIKAGVLSKFNGALTKYPKLFDSLGALLAKFALGLFQ